MKTSSIILFFSIVAVVLGLVNYYIFIRGLQCIPSGSNLRNVYIVVFWFVAMSFIVGRLIEKFVPAVLSGVLIWVGSFWLAAALYFLLAVIALDVLRLINHFFPFFPRAVIQNYSQAKLFVSIGIIGVVGILLLYGHINSRIPCIKKLNMAVAKKTATIKTLNIVAISDIHLGKIVGRSRLEEIVSKINDLNPDLVLMPGDIVDEDLSSALAQNPGEAFRNIKSRFGVYAATGNHEYFSGVEKACAYLTGHDITMLRDQSVKVGNAFYLVGREDLSMNRRGQRQRKELAEIMVNVDKTYPVILMDHQPFNLKEAAANGIDLQISGHTHNGQLWPFNYIVDSMYELSWGYKKIADTHFYVSDGVGTWGPPVRIGNRPEIVNIVLTFP